MFGFKYILLFKIICVHSRLSFAIILVIPDMRSEEKGKGKLIICNRMFAYDSRYS